MALVVAGIGCTQLPPTTTYQSLPAEIQLGEVQIQSGAVTVPEAESLTYLKVNGVAEHELQAKLGAIEVLMGCHFGGERPISHGSVTQCRTRLTDDLAAGFVDSFDESALSSYDRKKGRWAVIAPKIIYYINAQSELYYFVADVLDVVEGVSIASDIDAVAAGLDPAFREKYGTSTYRQKFKLLADRLANHLNEPNTKSARNETPVLVDMVLANLGAARNALHEAQPAWARADAYTDWLEKKFEYYPIQARMDITAVEPEPQPQPSILPMKPAVPALPPQFFELIIYRNDVVTTLIPLQIREVKKTGNRYSYRLESEPQQALTPASFESVMRASKVEIRYVELDVRGVGLQTDISIRE